MADKKWPESPDDRLREIEIYDHVTREIEVGYWETGLWTKATAESLGDEKETRIRYIELRVQMLQDESEQERKQTQTQEQVGLSPAQTQLVDRTISDLENGQAKEIKREVNEHLKIKTKPPMYTSWLFLFAIGVGVAGVVFIFLLDSGRNNDPWSTGATITYEPTKPAVVVQQPPVPVKDQPQVNTNPTRNPPKTESGVELEKSWIVSLGMYRTSTALKLIADLDDEEYLEVLSETLKGARAHSSVEMMRLWIGPYRIRAVAQDAANKARKHVYAVAGPDPIIRDMSAYDKK